MLNTSTLSTMPSSSVSARRGSVLKIFNSSRLINPSISGSSSPSSMPFPSESGELGLVPDRYSAQLLKPSPSASASGPFRPSVSKGSSPWAISHSSDKPSPSESKGSIAGIPPPSHIAISSSASVHCNGNRSAQVLSPRSAPPGTLWSSKGKFSPPMEVPER